MSVNATINGTVYALPTSGDVDWGAAMASFLAAVASNAGPSLLQFGNSATAGASYMRPGWLEAASDANEVKIPVPFAGRLSNLRVKAIAGPSAVTQSWRVNVNGAGTSLLATMAVGATVGSDLTHGVAVAAGDLVSVQVGLTSGTGATYAVVTMELTHQ